MSAYRIEDALEDELKKFLNNMKIREALEDLNEFLFG